MFRFFRDGGYFCSIVDGVLVILEAIAHLKVFFGSVADFFVTGSAHGELNLIKKIK